MGQAHISTGGLLDREEVASDKKIWPAIVVVIKKPGCKTAGRGVDSSGCSDLGEGGVAVIVIKKVRPVEIRDEEVWVTVIIVIGRRDALSKRDAIDSCRMRDVLESSVSLVEKQLRGAAIFVPNKQIQEAIVIDVRPHRGLGTGRCLRDATRLGDVRESAIAVVAK